MKSPATPMPVPAWQPACSAAVARSSHSLPALIPPPIIQANMTPVQTINTQSHLTEGG